jgi:hypothetical protein
MEEKSAPQEGPREGAAPASPGAGPNSPLQAAKLADGFNDPARRDPGGHQCRSDVVPATASARWRKG